MTAGMKYAVFVAAALGWMLCAVAAFAAPSEDPAIQTTPQGLGTTIVGEQESALGLYLMPWKEDTASDRDRPPALLDGSKVPLDTREIEYHETTQAWRRERLYRR